MLEIKLLLFVQGLRFLLFDYKLFASIREAISRLPLVKTLLKCPFCQGFWCGLFTFIFYLDIVDSFILGIGSGFISLTWYAWIDPKLDKLEDKSYSI